MAKQTLSNTQADALRLIAAGGYYLVPRTGGARYINHRLGSPVIASRTVSGLFRRDLVVLNRDRVWLQITEAGLLALVEYKEA